MLLLLNKCILIDGWNFPRVQFMTGNISFKPQLEKNSKTKQCKRGEWHMTISLLGFLPELFRLLALCLHFNAKFKVSNKKQHRVNFEWKHIRSPTSSNSLSHVFSVLSTLSMTWFLQSIWHTQIQTLAHKISVSSRFFVYQVGHSSLPESSLRKILGLAWLCQVLLLNEIFCVEGPFYFNLFYQHNSEPHGFTCLLCKCRSL